MEKYKDLLEKAEFLVSLGTPVYPNIEYERLISKALSDLAASVSNIHNPASPVSYLLTEKDKERAQELSLKYGIQKLVVEL